MRSNVLGVVCAAAIAVMGAAESAWAFAHLYVISEVYSSVDGKVQFIELRNSSNVANSEIFWQGSTIKAINAGGTMMHTFTFPANLPAGGGTVGTRVLLATQKFAMLPGAPAPDYIIPEGFLFLGAGSLQFSPNGATVPYTNLPTDGLNSINIPGGIAGNTPKNYKQGGMSGVEGAVNAPPGACCMGTDCQVMVEIGCEGEWTQGAACTPTNPCLPPPTGACCRAVTCSTTAAADCTGPNTAFVPFPALCNSAGVNTTPCCRADYNKAGGVSVQDIFDFLGGWFAGSTLADFTGNGAGVPTVQSIFDFLAAWFTGGC